MEKILIFKEEAYKIVRVALEVFNNIGCGFTEPIYQEAFEKELQISKIPYIRENCYQIKYKDYILEKSFRVDFECFGKIIVELKAVEELQKEHEPQIYNYRKASGNILGLLIYFGKKSLEYKRFIYKSYWKEQFQFK